MGGRWVPAAHRGQACWTSVCSCSSSAFLRGTPQRYPVSPPSLPTTRWHGTASDDRIGRAGPRHRPDRLRDCPPSPQVGHRSASRRPECRTSVRQTRCWNAVPRRSSGRSSACFGSRRKSSTARTVPPSAGSSDRTTAPREPPAQIAHQRLVRFGEADEADALVGGADQQPAERAIGESGADPLALRRPAAPRPGSCPAAMRSFRRPGFRSRSRPRPPRRPPGCRRPVPRAAGAPARPRHSRAASARYGRGTSAGSGTASSPTASPAPPATASPRWPR